jgi:hypothetical protein
MVSEHLELGKCITVRITKRLDVGDRNSALSKISASLVGAQQTRNTSWTLSSSMRVQVLRIHLPNTKGPTMKYKKSSSARRYNLSHPAKFAKCVLYNASSVLLGALPPQRMLHPQSLPHRLWALPKSPT